MEPTGLAFAWAGVFLLPTAFGWAVVGGIRLRRRLTGLQPSAPPCPEPIERLGSRLCRLHAELEAVENDTTATFFRAARVRAMRGAYLDVLSAACERLEVRPPATPGADTAPLAEIYRAEAALRDRGLDVRRRLPVRQAW
jgi:hypothetical protein